MANVSDTTVATTDKAPRSFTMSLDIDATPEEVWRALTDAGALVRWFPLQARVTPGLERHKGRDRHHAAIHQVTSLGTDVVWKRLLSPAAFVVTEGRLAQDERCAIRAATGDQLAGTIAWHNLGHDLFMIVDDLNEGIFRLSTWRAGGQTGVQAWMTTYDARHAARVREFEQRTRPLFERLFV